MGYAAEIEKKVLVLTDKQQCSSGTLDCLSEDGFSAVICDRLDRFETDCAQITPQLVLVDVGTSTLAIANVCTTVRNYFAGPLVVLADQAEELFQVLGLEMGADDYVVKPVSCTLLRARLRAVLRRRNAVVGDDAVIVIGDLAVDSGRREVRYCDKRVDLTSKEFDLMWYLACNARTILSRDQIYSALFGLEYNGIDRSIDIYISRLRGKLGDDASHPQMLKTVRGVGYLLGG
ncbi:MAG: response regulator transcription factor [Desulfuromonas sp.]|nr:response regulator transcription factor [Desulfuromonas sp.]